MGEPATFRGNSRFQVLSHLGTGGMGVVYEALDRALDMRVALKTLRIHDANQLLRFKHEFRSVRDIRHPNLVELGELFEDQGLWFFTMELVAGKGFIDFVCPDLQSDEAVIVSELSTLTSDAVPITGTAHIPGGGELFDTLITPVPALPQTGEQTKTAIDISALPDFARPGKGQPRLAGTGEHYDEERLRSSLRGLGAALAALHRAGKVHCDIKPSNVLVTPEGRVVVLDFSVVTELRETSMPGWYAIAGSPLYMAPEQASGKAVGPEADWYAVGVLIFEALTGQLPFVGRSPSQIIAHKLKHAAPHPAEVAPDVPGDLADLCARLLALSPPERPEEREILRVLGVEERRTWATGTDIMAPPFVGRRRELAELMHAFERSRSGTPVSVFIHGESGVGKTALCEHFLSSISRDPTVVVFRGQCHEREFVPYNALDGVVDDMGAYLRERFRYSSLPFVPTGVAPLLNVFPVLHGVPSLTQEAAVHSASGELRSQAFEALRQLIAWIAEGCTLVVVVDDIHWADADSIMLLDELLGTKGRLPLLFIATGVAAGREPSAGLAARLEAAGSQAYTIVLTGLLDEEAEELAHRLFERRGSSIGDIGSVVAETQGHPMLMDELVRHLAELDSDDVDTTMSGTQLDDALRTRVSRLSPAERAVVAMIAVAGMPVPRDALAHAVRMSPQELAQCLTTLRSHHLVRTSEAGPRPTVTTYHNRIGMALSATWSDEERRILHATLASALEATGAESFHLAIHYASAGLTGKAAEHAVFAARKAMNALAFDQAVALYRLALEGYRADVDARRALYTELGVALENAGHSKEAADAYRTAAEVASPGERLELHRRAAEQLLVAGYIEEGIGAIMTVFHSAGIHFPSYTRRQFLARILWHFAKLRVAPLQWKTRREAEVPTDTLMKMDVFWSASIGLSMADSVPAIYFGTRGTLLSLEAGEPFRITRFLSGIVISASSIEQDAVAERAMQACERAAAEDGSSLARCHSETARYVFRQFYGQTWRPCVEQGVMLEGMWRGIGKSHGFEIYFVVQFTSWAQSMLGDMHQLRRRVSGWIRDAERVGNRLLAVSLRTYHCLMHLSADDPGTAARDITDAIASWTGGRDEFQRPHVWALFSQGDIALYRGDVDGEALSQGLARFWASPHRSTKWMRWRGHSLQGRLAVVQAARAMAAGERGPAKKHLATAAEHASELEASGVPVQPWWGALIRAGIAMVRGEAELAAELLGRAHRELGKTETMLYAHAAAYQLGRVLGGGDGSLLSARAEGAMRELGVESPGRLAAMLIPGFEK